MISVWRFVYIVPVAFIGIALLGLVPYFGSLLYGLIDPYNFFLLLDTAVCLSCLLLGLDAYQAGKKQWTPMAIIFVFASGVFASFYVVIFKDVYFVNFVRSSGSVAEQLGIFFYAIDVVTLALLVWNWIDFEKLASEKLASEKLAPGEVQPSSNKPR